MDILTTGAALAVVIGLVQLLKVVIGDSRFIPLCALIIGVAIAFLTLPDQSTRQIIFQGIIDGLSAAGLYSGAKAMLKPSPVSSQPLA